MALTLSLNPAAKLLAIASYSVAVAPATTLALPMLALPIALLAFADLRLVFRRLLTLNLFILIVVASLLYAGDRHLALVVFVRSNLVLIVLLSLFAAADSFEIASAFARLGAPKKLVSQLFFSAKIALLIRAEFAHFRRALYLRGWRLHADMESYRLIAGFVGMLVIKSMARAEALGKSMRLRGFRGEIYTTGSRSPFVCTDFVVLFTALFALAPIGAFV
ncbi:hypothetical protein AGMMS50229_02910 [Campylobacterota bacterium]|nr:hypothetical protein AGMMS50229_02910 [Campylobacterota bacterium]